MLAILDNASALPRQSTSERVTLKADIDPKTLDLVEKQLLKLLGMKRKAVPRDHMHVPEYMREFFRKWNGETRDDSDPMTNVVRAIHHVGKCTLLYTLPVMI